MNQNFHVSVRRENIYHQWVPRAYSPVKSVLLGFIAQNLDWSTRYPVQMGSYVHLGRKASVRQMSRVRSATFVAVDQRNENALRAHTR